MQHSDRERSKFISISLIAQDTFWANYTKSMLGVLLARLGVNRHALFHVKGFHCCSVLYRSSLHKQRVTVLVLLAFAPLKMPHPLAFYIVHAVAKNRAEAFKKLH